MTLAQLQQRDYQDRVVEKAIGFFEADDSSIMIELPTGAGKTIVGLRICQHFERLHGWRTNWVSMRRNLLAQVADANSRFFGLEKLTPVSMFENDPPPADITVVDEAQHDAAASCVHIHARSQSRVILGLSATPYRTDSLKLAFRRVIRDAGIHRLIRDGWLAPFDHWSIPWWDPEHVAAAFLREPEKWGKSAVFFHRIDDCHEFAQLLDAGGHRCEVVTADTDRETQLDAYDSGEFDVVVNVGILNEGYDCPSLKTVFVRDASKLPTIQMAGRGFRLDLETGKLHCNIVQSSNAKWQFTRTATPRQAYAYRNGQWLSLGNSDIIDQLARDTLRRIADIPVKLPKFFSQAEQKKRRARDRRLAQRQEM